MRTPRTYVGFALDEMARRRLRRARREAGVRRLDDDLTRNLERNLTALRPRRESDDAEGHRRP